MRKKIELSKHKQSFWRNKLNNSCCDFDFFLEDPIPHFFTPNIGPFLGVVVKESKS